MMPSREARAGRADGSAAGGLLRQALARAATIAAIFVAHDAAAQIRVNPTGVNINSQGASSVYLTYGGLAGYVPAEAYWCGDVVDAAPGVGLKCVPGTLFGAPRAAYDRSRLLAGGGAFVDVMSIPPSIARRAYQAAERGAASAFFYVRRFVNPAGGADVYVSVTCRLTDPGARVPLSITRVAYRWDGDAPLLRVAPGAPLPEIRAEIAYTGTGRLAGRWEVVRPGEELPTETDLLAEAALPPDQRSSQRRYTTVGRFSRFVAPGDSLVLPGPDPALIPTGAEGTYRLLLRIEASEDKEADSDLTAAGAGSGVVHSGAVAGFPLPVVRYVVGSDGVDDANADPAARAPAPARPEDGATVPAGALPEFSWTAAEGAWFYRLDIETREGVAVAGAVVAADRRSWKAPPWARDRLAGLGAAPGTDGTLALRWRVVALGAGGRAPRPSPWRSLHMTP